MAITDVYAEHKLLEREREREREREGERGGEGGLVLGGDPAVCSHRVEQLTSRRGPSSLLS